MTNAEIEGLAARLDEESLCLQNVAWGRADGGQHHTISAMLADEAATALRSLAAKLAEAAAGSSHADGDAPSWHMTVDVGDSDSLRSAVAALAERDAEIAAARAEGYRKGLEDAAALAWSDEDDRPWEHWGEHRNIVTAQTVAKEIAAAILALIPADDKPAEGGEHD